MDFITTAIYFGIAATTVMFLFNIFHCVFASIFEVRIEKFGMLLTIGSKYFLKFKRNHTEYSLGWIPTGSYVKIAGMFNEGLDIEPTKIEEYMLLSKSPIVRFICSAGAPLLLLIPFILSASFIDSNGSLNDGFQVLNNVLYNIYQYLIGAIDVTQTETNWTAIANKYNEFPIILCLMTLFTAFTNITTLLTIAISEKIKGFYNISSIALIIFYLFICYKIIVLYFTLYGFIGGLTSFLKFSVTIYSISFILMLLIKISPKNKYI
ncbi:site-2 protease family protein [uncultured Kordia sp.]|uniref:site-2 protease family protein n=1 Tax=uncultured Kordia sp. TaxID=507699 RepID=UPI002610C709|nr:site-2 protease family protein [uncultured Kordia sp.]